MTLLIEKFLKGSPILRVKVFYQILYLAQLRRYKKLNALAFWAKNSKYQPFLKIFWKVGLVYFLDTLGVENFDEIALSLTVKEIAYILHFYIFGKNSKIQNGRHF